MLTNYYKAFGLIWKVENLELSQLLKLNNSDKIDIVVKEDNLLEWGNYKEQISDTYFYRIRKNIVSILIKDIGILEISNGNQILFKRDSLNVEDRDISNFILGSAIGVILIQRDILVFHANAMEKDNKSIMCLGPSGAGKSTVAYVLMKRGWKLISDDQVALKADGSVLQGIPRIKLWKESMDKLKIPTKNYIKVRKNINKYIIQGDMDNNFNPCKLKAIYILKINRNEVNENFSKIKEIKNEKDKFINLRDNIFRPRFVRGLGKESNNFVKLSGMIKDFKLFELILPNGIENMNQFLDENEL